MYAENCEIVASTERWIWEENWKLFFIVHFSLLPSLFFNHWGSSWSVSIRACLYASQNWSALINWRKINILHSLFLHTTLHFCSLNSHPRINYLTFHFVHMLYFTKKNPKKQPNNKTEMTKRETMRTYLFCLKL